MRPMTMPVVLNIRRGGCKAERRHRADDGALIGEQGDPSISAHHRGGEQRRDDQHSQECPPGPLRDGDRAQSDRTRAAS